MKSILIVAVVIAVVLACAVVGCRMFSKRSTEATIQLAAKPAGKIVCPVKIHGALARVWRGSVKADSIILPPNEAAVFEVETR